MFILGVFASLRMHVGKILEGIFSALKTENQDHLPETLKTEYRTLRLETFLSGSWELREMKGTWLASAFKMRETCRIKDRTVSLPHFLASQGNVLSWFTSLKMRHSELGTCCSELPKSLVCLLKSKSSSHLH